MKLRPRILLRLERQKIHIQVVGQSEALTEDAVLAVNITSRKVVGVGTGALSWKGMADFQTVWPFEHPRVIVDDWDAARFLLTELIARTCPRNILKPEVVLQVVTPLEGGLCPIEKRALLQLLEAAGANEGVVFESDTIPTPTMIDELFRSTHQSAATVSALYRKNV
ncbi:MAG: rod shape-determining protein [Armatimonas sp.]